MRINVYSQELTNEVQVEEKRSNTGLVYTAVRMMLHSRLYPLGTSTPDSAIFPNRRRPMIRLACRFGSAKKCLSGYSHNWSVR